MYAILEIGKKQYRVEKDSELLIDLMKSKEGQKVKFHTITLLRNDADILVGAPYVEKALIEAKVVEPEVKGEKLVVYKYKQKASYRRKTGHRQKYTKIHVTSVGFEKEKAPKAEKAEKPAEKA